MHIEVLECLKDLGFEGIERLAARSKYDMLVAELNGVKYVIKFGESLSEYEEHYCKALHRCPCIAVPNFVRCGNLVLSVREYFDETLDSLLRLGNGVSQSLALRILEDVARALRCIHENNLVYSDLKPENIGLRDGHAYLIDLDSLTRPFDRPRFITLSRAPPEYVSMGIVVKESDSYQLGLLIDEILSSSNNICSEVREELRKLSSKLKKRIPFEREPLDNVIHVVNRLLTVAQN